MIALQFEAEIAASAEQVFSLLADLRDYDRWLPPSLSFHGTVTISEGRLLSAPPMSSRVPSAPGTASSRKWFVRHGWRSSSR
jgi:hypothetical protein